MAIAEAVLAARGRPVGWRRPSWQSPWLAVGAGLVLALYLSSLLARLAVGREDAEILAFDPSLAPSGQHLLGTDGSGRDVLTTLVYSVAPTFELALLAGLAATLVGTAAGLMSGYAGGVGDAIVRGIADVLVAIPGFAALILVAAIAGRLSLVGMALLIALFSAPLVARVVRGRVLSLREQPFVTVSHLSGRGGAAIIVFELLPNLLALVAALFVASVSGALALAIALELIGLGPVGTQTLGVVLERALSSGAMSQGLWWWWLPPAAILILFFVGLFLASLAVDDVANPRLRRAA